MNTEGLKINFLGDSITQGVGTSGNDAIYLNLLKQELNLAMVRNYGISGTRIAVQQGKPISPDYEFVDKNDFCKRFSQMDDDADVVVVFGGTNDFGHGDAPLGEFNDRTPDTFHGACHHLFSGLVKKYLGKPIIIMTLLHRVAENKNTKECVNLKHYVKIIREVAEYYSLPVLDLYALSGLQPEIKEIKDKYIPDGLHPNDNGHRVIADKLKKFLEML